MKTNNAIEIISNWAKANDVDLFGILFLSVMVAFVAGGVAIMTALG